jgi:hypothetical protein
MVSWWFSLQTVFRVSSSKRKGGNNVETFKEKSPARAQQTDTFDRD